MTSELFNYRVLLVEDDRIGRCMGQRALEDIGCMVSVAGSCREALDLWVDSNFDLVVMDYRLPDGKGPDVVADARRMNRREPVVMLTAESEFIAGPQREKLGIAEVLTKPLDMKVLSATIALLAGAAVSDGNVMSEKYSGRFMLVGCPGLLGIEFLKGIDWSAQNSGWVGLDMRATRDIEDGVLKELAVASEECRKSGGRLCVVGLAGGLMRRLEAAGLTEDIDFTDSLEELEALGRRLASHCERRSVLDAVVRRDG